MKKDLFFVLFFFLGSLTTFALMQLQQAQRESSVLSATSTASKIKEYYLNFTPGTQASGEYKNVDQAVLTINSAKYGKIKQVYFEIAGRVANDNSTVWVQLYNVTDKHPVWYSEITFRGLSCQMVSSAPIVFDTGVKTYQIQTKSSLEATVYIDQARLRILAE